ncbi:MAG: glutamine synthetase [Ktedonobacterales bacterium]|nr:glutamine synthetase [Ktedonobacterales bacterium]
MAAESIMSEAEARGIRFCNLEFTDIMGMAKAVTVPVEQLPASLAEGRWFDGSSIEGFARVVESDMFLHPDAATFAVIPWETARGRIVCDVVRPDGTPFEGDPRARLRLLSERATRLGLRYEVAPEIEFFLLQQPTLDQPAAVPFDAGSYFDLVSEPTAHVWRDLMDALDALGVPVESSHHEVADGQHEIDLAMLPALAAADAIMTAKLAIKAVAAHHGLRATFMPKPFSGVSGSGMHIHQRCISLGDGRNAFADPDNLEFGLSETGLHFIAGLLAHAAGMSAVLSPLVNSYKRLIPAFEAPVEINWGHHNHDMLVRVPRVSARRPTDVQLEIRSPDPSCNPYLALTTLLAAGLDGIERNLECPPPADRRRRATANRREAQSRRLPESLANALETMEADALLREALGPTIFDEYLDAKWQEWEDYRREVTPWELRRYLALF